MPHLFLIPIVSFLRFAFYRNGIPGKRFPEGILGLCQVEWHQYTKAECVVRMRSRVEDAGIDFSWWSNRY